MYLAAAGCGGVVPSAEADEAATASAKKQRTFVDAESYVSEHALWDQWLAMRNALRGNFDEVCGDTFCEGDFSNLEALRLKCSTEAKTGVLEKCTYIFAGSYEDVDAASGAILPTAAVFLCELPVGGLKVETLLSTLSPESSDPTRPLQRPLAKGRRSIYDVLGECFRHPIIAKP